MIKPAATTRVGRGKDRVNYQDWRAETDAGLMDKRVAQNLFIPMYAGARHSG